MKGFNSYDDSQKLFPGGTVILFILVHVLAHISSHTLMAILNLRQNSPTEKALASVSTINLILGR